MAKPLADSDEMVMGPDAIAEDTVAGSDCADPAALEDNVRDDDTVSGVVAVSENDDDIVDVVDYVRNCAGSGTNRSRSSTADNLSSRTNFALLIGLEVVRLITCRQGRTSRS